MGSSSDSRDRLTPSQNLILGALSGAATKCFNYPLLNIKNRVCAGTPIVWSPVHLYRGVSMAILNLSSTSAVQYWLSSGCTRLVAPMFQPAGARSNQPSPEQKLFATALGCTLSGLWCGPLELCMIQMMYGGKSIPATFAHLVRTAGPGVLSRGMAPTMARECIYGTCMLAVTPLLRERVNALGFDSFTSLAASSLISATVASTLTQPFDCTKSCMQTDYERKQYTTWRHTIRVLVEQRGLMRLWSGNAWRIGLITTTFFGVHCFNDLFSPIFAPSSSVVRAAA
eukprot:TRINITY_DN58347_c0_g1_i1.p1 TRINITY_DN58347_c0_g1~~TRINITY_DN58347_c0_g1_i1.p1  ORF type:complete len:284 (-),score=29.84 TRINITY_DN58347_c0_g1_i1:39-890(-)